MEGQAAALRSSGIREAWRGHLCAIPAWLLPLAPPPPHPWDPAVVAQLITFPSSPGH